MEQFSPAVDSASSDSLSIQTGTTFIYALLDPRDERIRYVGKANDPSRRLRAHMHRKADSHCGRWLACLRALALRPVLTILEEVPQQGWQAFECAWIARLRAAGHDLTNVTDGGEGYNPDDETRAKMRAAKLGKKAAPRDYCLTPEARAKQSAAAKRRWARMSDQERTNYLTQLRARSDEEAAKRGYRGRRAGWHHTPEVRSRIGAAAKGRIPPNRGKRPSEESIRKTADALRGKKRPPEVLVKVSARCRALSVEQVAEIRRLLSEGQMKGIEIARQFGTSPTIVCRIGKRKIYATALDLPSQKSTDDQHPLH